MLLQKLVEYAERPQPQGQRPLARLGYNWKPVRYRIDIDETGQLLNPNLIEWVSDDEPRGALREMPDNGRSNDVAPRLLADDIRYTLGVDKNGKSEGVTKYHKEYIAMLEQCIEEIVENDMIAAVLTFLQNDSVASLKLPEKIEETAVITFRVNSELPIYQPEFQEYWQKKFAKLDEHETTCMICGQTRRTLRVIPHMIKGIPGSAGKGAAIISANKDVFESYGFKQAQNAPTCLHCADQFTKGLNRLLEWDNRQNRFVLPIKEKGRTVGGIAFAFWTRNESVLNIDDYFGYNPDPAKVEQLLHTLWSGRASENTDIDVSEFYAVALTATKARAVVRDWMNSTVGNVQTALAKWFQKQKIVDSWGAKGRPLGIYDLSTCMMRLQDGKRDVKELPVQIPQALVQCALKGTPLPFSLLLQTVERCRIGDKSKDKRERTVYEHVPYKRAALLKLILASHSIILEDEMVELEKDKQDPAYLCGRLLSILENIQEESASMNQTEQSTDKNRKPNSTVIDKFYGSASTTPATVFGTLMIGVQDHLSKLRRRAGKEAAYFALQAKLEELLLMLPEFPRTLKPQEQALFALGYYHQRASDRNAMNIAIQNKNKVATKVAK